MVSMLIKSLPILAIDAVYQVASTNVGQHSITVVDRILCIFEALNFYAAPLSQQQEARRESKEMHEYQRPLPWFLFIPMLLQFRVIRLVLSVIAYPLGSEPVTAMVMVYYIQSVRRKLRYIKIQGARLMRNPESTSSLPWALRMFINVVTWAPLQIFTLVARVLLGNKQYPVYASSVQPRSKRSLKKLKSSDTDECSTADLLDKYAEEDENDAENDPDFEVKATDLVSESEDDEEEEEEENSEPEEDLMEIKENGTHKEKETENGGATHEEQNTHNEHNPQPEENHHHHHEEHHHY